MRGRRRGKSIWDGQRRLFSYRSLRLRDLTILGTRPIIMSGGQSILIRIRIAKTGAAIRAWSWLYWSTRRRAGRSEQRVGCDIACASPTLAPLFKGGNGLRGCFRLLAAEAPGQADSVRHLRDGCVAHITHRCCQIFDVLHVDRNRRQPFQDHGSSVRIIPFANPIRVPVGPADVRPRARVGSGRVIRRAPLCRSSPQGGAQAISDLPMSRTIRGIQTQSLFLFLGLRVGGTAIAAAALSDLCVF